MKNKLILILPFLIFSFSIYAQTTISSSFNYDGVARNYRLYIPEIYDPASPTPLVFNLHGYGSDNLQQELYGDFRAIADTANFIICHPMGLTDSFGSSHWNTFGTSSVDDVGFISALIDTIFANYNIDGYRIYSTGMSNGGFMSYKLACLLSGRIAAVASVTGSITYAEFGDCITNHAFPIMQIHGTADGTVPFAGNALFMPVEDVVNHWVDFNSCNPVPVTTELEDIDTDDGCTAIHYLYEDGALGTTVEFYKIIGGEHTWPGSIYGESITNQDFNASVEIWRFFSQYNLLQLTSSIEASASVFDFKVFPNPTNGPIQIEFDHIAERQIILSNYLGAKILVDNSVDKNYEINIENSGLYFITVIENGMSKTIKFIKN